MKIVVCAFALSLLLAACPDREQQSEIGHAPKRQLDKVERAVNNAEQKMQQRAEKAGASAPALPEEP